MPGGVAAYRITGRSAPGGCAANRITGRSAPGIWPSRGLGVTPFAMVSGTIRIIGFDPGLTRTGWGVIEAVGVKLVHIANGAIATTASETLGVRLATLHDELCAILKAYAPDTVAVEQVFVAKNPSAALKLGHARAIALLAAAQAGLPIAEYAPNHIKKSVVGVGHAGKEQVQAMVRRLLPTAQFKSADAADALACAIAHAHLARTNARIAAALAS